ncbi:hypothetical protein J2T18_000082 [Paenibacillus polymyxa]|nr:hypothetical protein [Paenibacillus polymyxa]
MAKAVLLYATAIWLSYESAVDGLIDEESGLMNWIQSGVF